MISTILQRNFLRFTPPPPYAGVMECCAAEATGLGLFVLLLSTLACCQPTVLILGFLLLHKSSNLLPPPLPLLNQSSYTSSTYFLSKILLFLPFLPQEPFSTLLTLLPPSKISQTTPSVSRVRVCVCFFVLLKPLSFFFLKPFTSVFAFFLLFLQNHFLSPPKFPYPPPPPLRKGSNGAPWNRGVFMRHGHCLSPTHHLLYPSGGGGYLYSIYSSEK